MYHHTVDINSKRITVLLTAFEKLRSLQVKDARKRI